MRELRLVGPGEDGASVVVESDTGEQFSLPVDERLRAASRADRAHLGQIDSALAGPLRPRDIQIRVRAGESPDELADQSGMPVARVMRFAYPVLAERTRVADEARRARARRAGDGHLAPFGELVDSRLAAYGVEPETVVWDAFRRPDGGWTVTADVPDDEVPIRAKFSFSLGNRTVSALDDVAADLLSGRPVKALAQTGLGAERTRALEFGQLSAVPDPALLAPRSDRRQHAYTHPLPVPVDEDFLDQDVFDQEGLQPLSPAGYGSVSGQPAGEPDPASDGAAVTPDDFEPSLWTDFLPADAGGDPTPADADLPVRTEPAHAVSRRGGRHGDKPRMPSWDDILLGVRRKGE